MFIFMPPILGVWPSFCIEELHTVPGPALHPNSIPEQVQPESNFLAGVSNLFIHKANYALFQTHGWVLH